VDSCKRIRLMKSSEAVNLCKNQIHVLQLQDGTDLADISQVLTISSLLDAAPRTSSQ
jgi:hypothetical protein